MGKPGGFLELERLEASRRPVRERLGDFREVEIFPDAGSLAAEAGRCLDCGIPFCHASGCPLSNRIPDFNEMVFRGQWREGLKILHADNNFPEITGRVCPAPCEAACTLDPGFGGVSIRLIELELSERGWREGWIVPRPAPEKSGKKAAVIGSGPAGLAAAQELARRGHSVTVFEKAGQPGGLLRYGIPDFKLEKSVLERRLAQLAAEGVVFQTGVEAGADVSARYLQRSYDAILVAVGAGVPRDLVLGGRELSGISFALDYLVPQNLAAAEGRFAPTLNARGKKVVVVGGGDTGSDCVGTALRQGAAGVVQVELLPRPPQERDSANPWPRWPKILRTSSSQEEGGERLWAVGTKEFLGKGSAVSGLSCVRLDWSSGQAREIPGSEFRLEADLVLLALGFLRPDPGGLFAGLGVETDEKGNIAAGRDGATAAEGVFAAGDAAAGASLVVQAIASGRSAARSLHDYLSAGARPRP